MSKEGKRPHLLAQAFYYMTFQLPLPHHEKGKRVGKVIHDLPLDVERRKNRTSPSNDMTGTLYPWSFSIKTHSASTHVMKCPTETIVTLSLHEMEVRKWRVTKCVSFWA